MSLGARVFLHLVPPLTALDPPCTRSAALRLPTGEQKQQKSVTLVLH